MKVVKIIEDNIITKPLNQNRMKQTALEFYAEQEVKLTLDFLANKINQVEYGIKRVKLIEQAKEMEKEQIIDAHEEGFYSPPFRMSRRKEAEQYYNETFKSEE
jgi:hypothetical protein